MDNDKIKNSEIYKYIKDYQSEIPTLKVRKKEYLFRADCDDGMIYYILDGVVEIESISSNGKKLIVDVLREEEFVGFISNLHNAAFQCSGIAETDIEVLALEKNLMGRLLEDDEFSALFYRKTSKRVYKMYKTILTRTLFTPNEIMAQYILENSVDNVFVYKSIYNICENLGVSRRGIYNILYRLEEMKVIEKQGDRAAFKIIDREYLEKTAEAVMRFMKNDVER